MIDDKNIVGIATGLANCLVSTVCALGCMVSIIVHPNTAGPLTQVLATIVGYAFSEAGHIKAAIASSGTK